MKRKKNKKFRFGIRNANNKFQKGVFVKMIMKSIHSYPEYDVDDVFDQIHHGNAKDRDKAMEIIIIEHANLVCSIASKYRNYGLSFSDLVSEGNIGLMKAAEKYKSNRGVEFSTYASYWIRESITRALDNKSKMIRIPCQTAQKMRRLHTVEAELTKELDRQPTDQELVEHTGYSKKQIQNLRNAKVRTYSFANKSSNDLQPESRIEAEANYPDKPTNSPAQKMISQDSHYFFYKLIDQLDERESKIIKMYFGLESQKPQTHLSISQHVGISRERVRQIQKECLSKLRKIMSPHVEEIFPIMES